MLLHFCCRRELGVDPSRPSGRIWGASADNISEVARLVGASRFEYEVSLPATTSLTRLSEKLDALNLRFRNDLTSGVLLFERRSRASESFVELTQDTGSFLPASVSSLMEGAPWSAQLQAQIVGSRRRKLRVSSSAIQIPVAALLRVVNLVPTGVVAEGWLYGSHMVLSQMEASALVQVTTAMFGRSVVDELRGAASESVSGLSQLLELIEDSRNVGASIDLPVLDHVGLHANLVLRWKKPPGEVPSLAVSASKLAPEATTYLLATLATFAASGKPE